MRDLQRNQRTLWFASQQGVEPVLDEWGNDTLEVRVVWGEPRAMKANVSAAMGEYAQQVFGDSSSYTRVVSLVAAPADLKEGCAVWFGVSLEERHNYEVSRVADSKVGVLIALREVRADGTH